MRSLYPGSLAEEKADKADLPGQGEGPPLAETESPIKRRPAARGNTDTAHSKNP